MTLPDFRKSEALNLLKQRMGIPNDHYGAFAGSDAKPRAFVLFRSGRRLDLLNPCADSWTDADLALNLARISRWGGATKWARSLSVAQHSLLVLRIREQEEALTSREALRELLHDASEGFLGWDPIGPLKAHLGAPFLALEQRLQALVSERYDLPAWDAEAYRKHKRADRRAAASEACNVVGWSRDDMRDALGIVCQPLEDDPLPIPGLAPWEPWPPPLAEAMFLQRLLDLQAAAELEKTRLVDLPAFAPRAR